MEQDFCERLKNYRRARNLTQRELAEQVGVSDKTVSRWESGGGYPDVPVLVPLAKALGVTVDDLLNEERPVRTLTKTDWQNLLSFAFALGGGVLFFLLDLFMPALLCYLGYLGCLAYGVYLQKYYAYQSRWFLLGEAVVNLGVNLSIALGLVASLGAMSVTMNIWNQDRAGTRLLWWGVTHLPEVAVAVVLLALALTAATQCLVWEKGFGGQLGGAGKILRLGWGRPSWRRLLPALVPLLAGLYWLPALWREVGPRVPRLLHAQDGFYLLWLLVLALLAALPLLKRGYRKWIPPAWVMTALCWGMTGLRVWEAMWSDGSGRYWDYRAEAIGTGRFFAVGWGTGGTLLFALGLAAAWLLLSCLTLQRAAPEAPAPTE